MLSKDIVLESISEEALLQGFDVEFIDTLDDEQKVLVYEGLKHNVDVLDLLFEGFTTDQVFEIVVGASDNVDYSLYRNVYYSADQMSQIRQALFRGHDVSKWLKILKEDAGKLCWYDMKTELAIS